MHRGEMNQLSEATGDAVSCGAERALQSVAGLAVRIRPGQRAGCVGATRRGFFKSRLTRDRLYRSPNGRRFVSPLQR